MTAAIQSACRICQDLGPHRTVNAREMMFGTREPFLYFECEGCGSVQISAAPGDLGRFYANGYYSYRQAHPNPLAEFVIGQRTRHLLGLPNILGGIVSVLRRDAAIQALSLTKPKRAARILDVGCGVGKTLDRLAAAGFKSLHGIDPHIAHDLTTPGGVEVRKQSLEMVRDMFDVIMFHHSLEHVIDPVGLLRLARERLFPDGRCIVRIPTPSSEAWDTYGANWVQLDAPRHLVLPSRRGLEIAAREAGFAIEMMIDDSTDFQFVGSERYVRDISLNAPASHPRIDRGQRAEYRRRARALNRRNRGDQTVFILRQGAVSGFAMDL